MDQLGGSRVPADRPATAAAHAAVVRSAHPEVSWSLVLEARLATALDPEAAAERVRRAIGRRPRLGPTPAVRFASPQDVDSIRTAMADRPYEPGSPLLRIAVMPGPGARVLLAAHHGILDGLGMVALLGTVLDSSIGSSARGLGERPIERSFASLAASRLLEAAVFPTSRISPSTHGDGNVEGDELVSLELPALAGGTAGAIVVVLRAVSTWNRRHGARADRVTVAVGASRHPGDALDLREDSAYLRIRLPRGREPDEASMRRSLATAKPQPGAPTLVGWRIFIPVLRRISGRLGSTLLVSNLGMITGPPDLEAIAFYPSSHGRSGVALGAATVGNTATLTLRARRRHFDHAGATAFLQEIAAHATAGQRPSARADDDGQPK